MEIRDARDKEWTWMDNEYLNGYAKHLGPICSVVYFSLCRYSDNTTQRCFPSMGKIAVENGVSEKSVSRAIKTLSEWGIILVEEKYDKKNKRRKNNVYTLLKKNGWKQKPPDSQSSGNDEKLVDPPDSQSMTHQTDVPSNYTYIKNTNTSEQGSRVGEIIKSFEDVDPKNKTYYGNKTQRGACDFLIQEYGFEQVMKVIAILPKTNRLPYMPIVTTPVQLKDKWTQLESGLRKKKAESEVSKNNLI